MHEAKYEPMDKVDAEKIMEEILGMKAGLNPDQQVRLMNASNCQIMMLHVALWEDPKKAAKRDCW